MADAARRSRSTTLGHYSVSAHVTAVDGRRRRPCPKATWGGWDSTLLLPVLRGARGSRAPAENSTTRRAGNHACQGDHRQPARPRGVPLMATANGVRKTMAEISKNFPTGLEYRIVDDPTVFIQESVNAVPHTLLEAFALVFMVVLIFLQDWWATLLIAKGAGAEMRQALGTSVFSGILGGTFFGLVLTPVFYVVIRWFIERQHR